MAGNDTSILQRKARPSASPASVPITPTMAPCTMKMPMMEAGEAPQRAQDGNIRALVLSRFITRVETRLNAATATISVRMMNIMRFSTCTAATSFVLLRPVAQVQNSV